MQVPALAVNIGVFVVGLVVFHLLERLFPIYPQKGTGPTRRGYLADLTASIVNGPVMSTATKLAAFAIVIFLPQYHTVLSSWNWWVQFAVFFLVNDFLRYWLHRWYHTNPLLWRIHRVHHTVVEMDALSSLRVHLLEAVIKYGVIILPFYVFGIDKWVVTLYTAIDLLKAFWHHANLRTYIGPLNYIFNSAEQHWWHHSIDFDRTNVNYGSVLSIWDILFGSFLWKRGEWPRDIGVADMDGFPETYLGQLASVAYDDEAARRCYGAAARAGRLPEEAPRHRGADDLARDAPGEGRGLATVEWPAEPGGLPRQLQQGLS